ncbi:MAG: pyrroline-5-carboxylate reductase [bacterium]
MTIGFIGAGNMATALAGAFAAADPDLRFVASDVNSEQIARLAVAAGAERTDPASTNAEVAEQADILFLAVKPQILPSVLPELAQAGNLVVSIAAGTRISTIEAVLTTARVVRVMPNTPGLVGEMAAGYAAGSRATPEDMQTIGRLLSSAGVAIEVTEDLLDTVTGISGSGPAFVARLIEAFTKAGVDNGLSEDQAGMLVRATFSGTAKLLSEKALTPEELVKMVSSPNGTTVAGREILESSDYADIIQRTVARTIERSRELGA